MISSKISMATMAAIIAIGTLGLSMTEAGAASMKPSHHVLTCKAGSVAHLVRVKVNGKWHKVWKCHRVKHHVKPKPKTY